MGFWEQFILCNHETYVILGTNFFFLFFFRTCVTFKTDGVLGTKYFFVFQTCNTHQTNVILGTKLFSIFFELALP